MENVHSRIEARPDSERSPSFPNRATWTSTSYFETDLAVYLIPSLILLPKAGKNGAGRVACRELSGKWMSRFV